MQGTDFFSRKWAKPVLTIPLALTLLLLAVSYKTHWLFYVTEEGSYTRGSLFFLQLLLPYCYLAASLVSVFIIYKKKKNKRIFHILLAAFAGAGVASVLQVLFSGSFTLAGMSLVTILSYFFPG